MVTLKGEHINLRALEPSDISLLESTENNEDLWHLSHSITPFSRYQLEQYILNADADIYQVKQLRLVISDKSDNAIGFIDLFDFDPLHKRAGIGIVISTEKSRGKGYGKDALNLLINYAFNRLNLHQLYCNILESNKESLRLFEGLGFSKVGLKKDWLFWEGTYHNEWQLQLINHKDVH